MAVGTLAERKGKDELEPFRFKPSQCSRTLVTGKPSRARTHRYSGPFLPYRSKGNHHTYSLYDELPSPPPSSSWNLPPRRWKWGWNKGDRYLHNEGVWSWNLQSAANEGRVEAVDQEIEDEMKTTMSLDEVRQRLPFHLYLKFLAEFGRGQTDALTLVLCSFVASRTTARILLRVCLAGHLLPSCSSRRRARLAEGPV